MAFGSRRAKAAWLLLALTVTAGSVTIAELPASADVTCPVIYSTDISSITPAPGVDWAGCDLENANFENANLTGANLDGADLTGAVLYQATLSQAGLQNATLAGDNMDFADLTGANLVGANLDGAYLNYGVITGADLGNANLTGVTWDPITSGGVTGNPVPMPTGYALINGFVIGPGVNAAGADLSGAYLVNYDLTGDNFKGANLSGANMSGIKMQNGSLNGADLTDANLTNANLTGVDMTGADFTGAVLYGVISTAMTGKPKALPANWYVNRTSNSNNSLYLIGPGANLSGANLSYDSVDGYDLHGANLNGALLIKTAMDHDDLTGANLAGIDAQQVNFNASDLTGAQLQKAYLYYATLLSTNLTNASLTNANLTGATLTGATVTGTDWTGVTCPDGTLASQQTPANCTTPGGTPPPDTTPPGSQPGVSAERMSMDGWYTTPSVTVNWNWEDNGQINTSECPPATTVSGNGSHTVTSACTDMAGNTGNGVYHLKIDASRPVVSVTGVKNGATYVYGKVPAAGCATVEKVSGVAKKAAAKIITSGENGTGAFTVTCAGAASAAGLSQTSPVKAHYSVVYGFGGFVSPAAGSKIKKAASMFTVKFRLASASGKAIPAWLRRRRGGARNAGHAARSRHHGRDSRVHLVSEDRRLPVRDQDAEGRRGRQGLHGHCLRECRRLRPGSLGRQGRQPGDGALRLTEAPRATLGGRAAGGQAHQVAVDVDVEFPAAVRAEFVLVTLPRLVAHLTREARLHEQHKLEGGAVDPLVERRIAPVLRRGEQRGRHGQRAQVGEQRAHLVIDHKRVP